MTRILLRFTVFLLGWAGLSGAVERVQVDMNYVRGLARALAASPYKPDSKPLPSVLRKLSYDQYRRIQFNTEKSLWGGDHLGFVAQFYHLGWIFKEPVTLNEFTASHCQKIPFVSDFFRYGNPPVIPPRKLPDDLGYAGFRINYPLNRPNVKDELISFLGASYFRALGRGQRYGISARGLALDTGLPHKAEEFPRFKEFWLGKPKPGAKHIVIYALLDSPSVAGAYQFTVTPGKTTEVDVSASLFVRKAVDVFGVAPLTSMFWYGENTFNNPGDFRPEVHDSDGLSIEDKEGDWIWRPLINVPALLTTDFPEDDPKGFGLMQRDRDFRDYQDLEAEYQLRPSVWIQPESGWGKGTVRLIELPTASEYQDNIVAFWVPAKNPKAGEELNLRYRLSWLMESRKVLEPEPGRVEETRVGRLAGIPQGQMFVLEFSGKELAKLPMDAPVTAVVDTGSNGRLLGSVVMKNNHDQSWRAVLKVEALDMKKPVDLKCVLKNGYNTLTETWTYHWIP